MSYFYESLNGWSFQQLCQVLVSAAFPGVQSFPIYQADGGRDAADHSQSQVFQCKWTSEPSGVTDPVKWIIDEVKQEENKIRTLHDRGLRRYLLLTNVSGSSTFDSGEMDRLARQLQELLGDLEDLAVEPWWRESIDAHVTNNLELQWKFPQILSGGESIRLVLATLNSESAVRRDRALRAYLASQYEEESHLRFKQAYSEPPQITDLFVDVPALPTSAAYLRESPTWRLMRLEGVVSSSDPDRYRGEEGAPAAAMLVSRRCADRIQINGAPGQGKSTLLQYVCQLQRAQVLGKNLDAFAPTYRHAEQRVPFKLLLKDYIRARRGRKFSLEEYFAAQISAEAGGASFDIDDFNAICADLPVFVALDALDEVADDKERNEAVKEIQSFSTRLNETAADAIIVITSRPVQDPSALTLPQDRYLHLTLDSLPGDLADEFIAKWVNVQKTPSQDRKQLVETWNLRRRDAHVQNLATNPMQLGILLQIIDSRGPSLPDRRTLLYDDYIRTLFDREADKDSRVAQHRDILTGVHGYVAFRLHSDAESEHGDGIIGEDQLKSLLHEYLNLQGRDSSVEGLFKGVQRVVALVSRKRGTFEFEVQPLREYFCGRFLYDTSPYVLPGMQRSGQKHERLHSLIDRPYWQNVLRFFAGCFHSGELYGLFELLRSFESYDRLPDFLSVRRLVFFLVKDRIFSEYPKLEARAIKFAADRASRHAISSIRGNGRDRAERTDSGAEYALSALREAITETRILGAELQGLDHIWSAHDLADAWYSLGVEKDSNLDASRWLELGLRIQPMPLLDMTQCDTILEKFDFDPNIVASFAWSGNLTSGSLSAPLDTVRTALDFPAVYGTTAAITHVQRILSRVSVRRMLYRRRGVVGGNSKHRLEDYRIKSEELAPLHAQLLGPAKDAPGIESALWSVAVLDHEFGPTWHSTKLHIATSMKFRNIQLPPQLQYYDAGTASWAERFYEIDRRGSYTGRDRDRASWLLAVLCTSGPTKLYNLASYCEVILHDLPVAWLYDVVSTARSVGREITEGRIERDEIPRDLFRDYPLTGACLMGRLSSKGDTSEFHDALFERLPEPTGVANLYFREVLGSAVFRQLLRALRGGRPIDEIDQLLLTLQALGPDLSTSSLQATPPASRLPIDTSRRIASEPNLWPGTALLLAEQSLRGRSQGSLTSISNEQEWFKFD